MTETTTYHAARAARSNGLVHLGISGRYERADGSLTPPWHRFLCGTSVQYAPMFSEAMPRDEAAAAVTCPQCLARIAAVAARNGAAA